MSDLKKEYPTKNKPNPTYKTRDLLVDPVDKELSIDDTRLNQELMDQPLYFRKYTKILSDLQKKAQYIKYQLEESESTVYSKVSNDGTGKKVKEIESAVALDEGIMRLKRELCDAETMVSEFEGVVKAFYQRHEMLKDLCANRRKELVD